MSLVFCLLSFRVFIFLLHTLRRFNKINACIYAWIRDKYILGIPMGPVGSMGMGMGMEIAKLLSWEWKWE